VAAKEREEKGPGIVAVVRRKALNGVCVCVYQWRIVERSNLELVVRCVDLPLRAGARSGLATSRDCAIGDFVQTRNMSPPTETHLQRLDKRPPLSSSYNLGVYSKLSAHYSSQFSV
jgi:hypothetical protein